MQNSKRRAQFTTTASITAKYMYVGQRAERALRRGRGLINSSRAIHLFITAQGPVPRP